MPTQFVSAATSTVFMGMNIPAHDETFDLAESIGRGLADFHEYVTSVRSKEQADDSVKELLTALLAAA